MVELNVEMHFLLFLFENTATIKFFQNTDYNRGNEFEKGLRSRY